MVVTLLLGLLGLLVLALGISIVVLALDEDPHAQNVRALRERAEAAANAPARIDAPACADLPIAA